MEPRDLIHELWEEQNGCTMVCIAGPTGDGARSALAPGARLAWVFGAMSHLDAMARCHARMGWPAYNVTEPWDAKPYQSEWIDEQRAALAAALGDREVISASACAHAWRAAAADLGIRLESPFAMYRDGTTYWCAGWLPDFGGPKGAIVACRFAVDDVFDVADALGFYASGLNPYYYESYDRSMFSETLNDWGWFGEPSAAPSWFTGAHGRHGGRE